MRDYELRRGHWKNLDGDKLPKLLEENLGPVEKDGEWYVCRDVGALKWVKVKVEDKAKVWVDSETDRSAPMEVAQQTMRMWNDFLENLTGYNAKQRGKRAQEAAKKASAEDADVPDA